MGKKTVRGHDIANRFVYSLRVRLAGLSENHLQFANSATRLFLNSLGEQSLTDLNVRLNALREEKPEFMAISVTLICVE